ncbi:hypothetical protein McPS_18150 [Marichromatium sp. PS1]
METIEITRYALPPQPTTPKIGAGGRIPSPPAASGLNRKAAKNAKGNAISYQPSATSFQ